MVLQTWMDPRAASASEPFRCYMVQGTDIVYGDATPRNFQTIISGVLRLASEVPAAA
jgi:hypothetical protein